MDTIEPGTDFIDVIREAVNECDVFLSIIGTQWTTVADARGVRRLDDPSDWVIAETAAALQRNAPVMKSGGNMLGRIGSLREQLCSPAV
jgi:hypothetical protein